MLVAFGSSIHFDELREVYILMPKLMDDGIPIRSEAISGYLEAIITSGAVKFLCKLPSVIKDSAP